MTATRYLAIEEHWTPTQRRNHSRRSLIRLKGHWLHEAGFTPGQRAQVTVEPGQLTITITTKEHTP